MSGGSLGYFFTDIQEHVGDFGDKEIDELVNDIATLFHDREWFLSGDTGEGDWNEARDAFKAKWFTPTGRADRIEKYLAEIGQEVRGMLGLREYCQDCIDHKCECPEGPTIDDELTAGVFQPICQSYKEQKCGGDAESIEER